MGAYHRNLDLYGDDEPIATNWQHLQHEENVRANDRFVMAMAKAVKRGREKATPGTYVDRSEPVYHKRLYGASPRSNCGSPSAMCIESGGAAQGAQAMKRSPSYG